MPEFELGISFGKRLGMNFGLLGLILFWRK